jgi:hypothetical protein
MGEMIVRFLDMTNKEWMRINWIGYPAGKVIDRLIPLFIPVLIPSMHGYTRPTLVLQFLIGAPWVS